MKKFFLRERISIHAYFQEKIRRCEHMVHGVVWLLEMQFHIIGFEVLIQRRYSMKIESHFNISERIRELVKEKGWKQSTLSSAAGIKPSTISEWFSGKHEPSVEMIEKVCGALGITMEMFFRNGETELDQEILMLESTYSRLPEESRRFIRLLVIFIDGQTNDDTDK